MKTKTIFEDHIKFEGKFVHLVIVETDEKEIAVFMDGKQVGYQKND